MFQLSDACKISGMDVVSPQIQLIIDFISPAATFAQFTLELHVIRRIVRIVLRLISN